MTDFTVCYRYYAYDDGHHHWTDDYVSFDTESAAIQFIADLDQRIADGDHDVRPGRLIDPDDLRPGRRRGSRTQPAF